jgi:YgiT-type zinc finger domain-containing protein
MNEQTCHQCDSPLESRSVTRLQHYQGQWFIIENVPALVCPRCGAQYFTPDAHDLVVAILSGPVEPLRRESVAVYDASRVA